MLVKHWKNELASGLKSRFLLFPYPYTALFNCTSWAYWFLLEHAISAAGLATRNGFPTTLNKNSVQKLINHTTLQIFWSNFTPLDFYCCLLFAVTLLVALYTVNDESDASGPCEWYDWSDPDDRNDTTRFATCSLRGLEEASLLLHSEENRFNRNNYLYLILIY